MANTAVPAGSMPGGTTRSSESRVRVIEEDGRIGLALQTPRACGKILCAPVAGAPDSAIPAESEIHTRIAAWQSRGYVLEDACVLALFALTGSRSDDDFLLGGHLRHTHMPTWHDDMTAESFRPAGGPFPEMREPAPGIYPIVDNLLHLQLMLDAGAGILQLRIKSDEVSETVRRDVIRAVRTAESYPDCQLFINDHWRVALEAGAYGVHLGQEDLLTADLAALQRAGIRLGVSSHAFWEVARALTVKPSYVACGPLFPTRAKAMPWIPQGVANLHYWTRLIPHPVIGIGGVTRDRLPGIRQTGCAGASVIQAIVAEADPAAAFASLQDAWLSATTPVSDGLPALARPTLAE